MSRKAASKKIRRIGSAEPKRLVLRITLRHIAPPIWREISVPDSYSLLQLHRCIQVVFEWLDYHPFEFRHGGRRFVGSYGEMDGENAANVRLSHLELNAKASLLYVYDLGDHWEHDIAVRTVASAAPGEELDPLGYLLDGLRAAPPEDAEGPPGYDRALAAFAKPKNRDDEDLLEWLGPDFDPERFDRRAGNHALILATAWGAI